MGAIVAVFSFLEPTWVLIMHFARLIIIASYYTLDIRGAGVSDGNQSLCLNSFTLVLCECASCCAYCGDGSKDG